MGDKIWQMLQSNDAKTLMVDSFEDFLDMGKQAGSFEFIKNQSLCTFLSRSHTRLQTCSLAVSGKKNDQGTLGALSVTTPQRIVMSFESSCNKFFVNSLGPTSSMSSTCTPMQMSSSVFTKQTGIALILNETVFFQLARQMFLQASRRCYETQHGPVHSPNHTSAIRQNLWVPAFKWMCVQLFVFTDFSVEESLCV